MFFGSNRPQPWHFTGKEMKDERRMRNLGLMMVRTVVLCPVFLSPHTAWPTYNLLTLLTGNSE